MRRLLAFSLVIGFAGLSWAGQDEEEPRREPRRHIKVLQNPYDIASFYRSSQESNYFGLQPRVEADSRYPIASYYRSRQGRSFGYLPVPAPYAVRRPAHRRSASDDLFLFAPTFLAPVGPLSGAFFER